MSNKVKFGLSGFVGLGMALAFVIGGVIATGHVLLFWNLPSLFIIVGGTVGSLVISFPPNRLKNFGKTMLRALKKDGFDIKEDIATLIELSELSRKEGLLALEDYVEQATEDEFIKRGILLIVDGADEDQLRNSLEGASYFMKQRHNGNAAMIGMVASCAPSLGLLGTYVGLIPMLNSLDNPSTLGPMMALELVSSFYGAFISYVIFAPMAKRLSIMSKEESSRREIVIEGLAAIQQGKNPKLIKAELCAFANIELDEEAREEAYVEREVASQS